MASSPSSLRHQSLNRNLIASLARGLIVLEAIAAHEDAIPLALLAQSVGMKKTNTWRLVHTLVQMGYVHQDAKTRSFRPAPRVLSLGYAYFDRLDLKQLAKPFLQDLASRFNETVNLAVLDGDELVYVDRIRTSQIIDINFHIGSRLPLYNTSLGRALICEFPPDRLKGYLSRISKEPTARDYIRHHKLVLGRRLESARRLGYAINDEELVAGLRSIASPIRGSSGEIVGAVGVASPSSRMTMVQMKQELAPALMQTVERISAALGYRSRL